MTMPSSSDPQTTVTVESTFGGAAEKSRSQRDSTKQAVVQQASLTETEAAILPYQLEAAEAQFPKETKENLVRWLARQNDVEVMEFQETVRMGVGNQNGSEARYAILHALLAEQSFLHRLSHPSNESDYQIDDPKKLRLEGFQTPEEIGLPPSSFDPEKWPLPKGARRNRKIYIPSPHQPHVGEWMRRLAENGEEWRSDLDCIYLHLIGRYLATAILHGDAAEIRRLASEVAKARHSTTGRVRLPRISDVSHLPDSAEPEEVELPAHSRYRVHRALQKAFDKYAEAHGKLPTKNELWTNAHAILKGKQEIPLKKRAVFMRPLGYDVLPKGTDRHRMDMSPRN